ncbi:sialic acid-binding Ig-like lectin 5 isoform X1 [Molossus molossus]|uniref:Sialic acid binding Ig like lectin 5 n=1 Tax=Molossus molossus TaxID=27622 RepID=A0A7J8CB14_MOLMO|nr:sialic acid-binding Ig-like lectin 5 isoform X1 [Molossus molossus]KAF6408021.1 sialic acid binding Ig like lectin 5 [Molossus molossus]
MVPLLLLPLLWGGSLQQLRVQESVTVQEGLCVHVPCSFPYPWSSWSYSGKLYTYWYRKGDHVYYDDLVATNNRNIQVNTETRNRFLLADPSFNNCSLRIRDARMRDAGTYFFRVEKGSQGKYSYQNMLTLQVTGKAGAQGRMPTRGTRLRAETRHWDTLCPGPEAPVSLRVTLWVPLLWSPDISLSSALTEKPNIHIPEPLESGRPTQLTCSLPGSCEGGQPLTFSWAGAAVDSRNLQNSSSWMPTFTPRPQDHGTNLTCQVKLQGSSVTTQRTIQLNVSYAPQNLTIDIAFRNGTALKILQNTSLPIPEGEALRLLCVAESNPPAQLSWVRGSPALNATPVSSTAMLELPRGLGTAEEGEFTCQAQHPLGSRSLSLSLLVFYPPQLLGPSCSWEDQGLLCSCSSRAQPAPSVRWRLGEGLLEGNHSNASYTVTSRSAGPWANSSLSLSGELSTGLRISCEARNVHGAPSAAVLLLPGKSVSAGVVSAALGGAGAMALVSLCLCLIFFCIVKARRKPAAGRPQVRNKEDVVMGTVTWGPQKNPRPDRPPHQAPPAEGAPLSGEPQELHYANLAFHGFKLREPQDQGATSTSEYTEIKKTSN